MLPDTCVSEYAETALGRKLTSKEKRGLEIARYADGLMTFPESKRVAMTAAFFGVSDSTVR